MGIKEYKTPERIPIAMAIDEKILDELIAGYKKPEDLIGENGLLKELTRAAVGTGNECGDDGASWS